jgi:hypothetical protein
VLGQGIAEPSRQPVVRAAHALTQVEQARQREPAVGRRHHFLRRDVPAGDRLEDLQRLVVLVRQEVTEPDLVAQTVAVARLAHMVAAGGRQEVRGAHDRHVPRVVHRHLHALHGRQESL